MYNDNDNNYSSLYKTMYNNNECFLIHENVFIII